MVISEVVTLLIYAVSMVFLPEFFGMYTYTTSRFDQPDRHSLGRPVICRFSTLRLEGRGYRRN